MSSFEMSPGSIPKSHAGSIYVAATGYGTSWSGATVFTATTLPTGATFVGYSSVTSTSALLEFTTGSGTGSITVSDGATSTPLPVRASTMSATVPSIPLSATSVVTVNGVDTCWSSESGGSSRPNFAISGVAGCTLVSAFKGTDPPDNEDTNADLTITTGSTAGTLTITDNGTGITTTITVGSEFYASSAGAGVTFHAAINFSGSTWTDIFPYLRSMHTEIPPSATDDVHPPGRATFVLDNRTGRFTPGNVSGTHYPYVHPGKRIRIMARYGGVVYNVWMGIIDDWGDTYPAAKDGYATITAWQPSVLLSNYDVPPGGATAGADELTSDRIDRVLTTTGWDLYSSLQTGIARCQATDSAGDQFSVAAAAVRTEGGSLWCQFDTLVFENRYSWWMGSHSNTSLATFGPADIPYHGEPVLSSGFEWVRNQVTRGNVGGVAVTVTDSASIATTGATVKDSDVNLIGNNDLTSASLATGVLIRRATPVQFPKAITIKPAASPATCWPQVLGRLINDRVTVKVPLPWGATLTRDCWIVGIRHSAVPGRWETTFDLVPAGAYDDYAFAIVGTAIVGTSVVAY